MAFPVEPVHALERRQARCASQKQSETEGQFLPDSYYAHYQ